MLNRKCMTGIGILMLITLLLAVEARSADEISFEVRHAPEIASVVKELGGEERAHLRRNVKIFRDQRDPKPGATNVYGENFEVDVSDSEICSQFGFPFNRITGIAYPRFYRLHSVEAALKFAAVRVLGNQQQRGESNLAAIDDRVAQEANRISVSPVLAKDKLFQTSVGQNDSTAVYFYARSEERTANVTCHDSNFYKRCTIYANLEALGFATTIRKDLLHKPNVMSCHFLAFDSVSREVLLEPH